MSTAPSDGGLYVPVGLPDRELLSLQGNECSAQILNMLLGTELTGADLDYCIGRNPFRLVTLGQRMAAAECWHSPAGTYADNRDRLGKHIGLSPESRWGRIALNAAALGNILSQLPEGQDQNVDVAAVTGDLSMILAAWYLKQWGFPVGKIIACCTEKDDLWELLYQGVLRMNGDTPDYPETERILYHLCGPGAVAGYLEAVAFGKPFWLEEHQPERLREHLASSVIGTHRLGNAIAGMYASRDYVLSPDSALIYAGVQDYRAKVGKYAPAILVAEDSPELNLTEIAQVLQISEEALQQKI